MNVSHYSRTMQILLFGQNNGARKLTVKRYFYFHSNYDMISRASEVETVAENVVKCYQLMNLKQTEVLIQTYIRQLSPSCNSNPLSHSGYPFPLLLSIRACYSSRGEFDRFFPRRFEPTNAFTRYEAAMNCGRRRLCMVVIP